MLVFALDTFEGEISITSEMKLLSLSRSTVLYFDRPYPTAMTPSTTRFLISSTVAWTAIR